MISFEATLSRQMNMGSLTCWQIWVHTLVTHEGGSGTNKSVQELTQRDRKNSLTLPRQGIEPRVFRLELWHSNHWATCPVLVLAKCVFCMQHLWYLHISTGILCYAVSRNLVGFIHDYGLSSLWLSLECQENVGKEPSSLSLVMMAEPCRPHSSQWLAS